MERMRTYQVVDNSGFPISDDCSTGDQAIEQAMIWYNGAKELSPDSIGAPWFVVETTVAEIMEFDPANPHVDLSEPRDRVDLLHELSELA